MAKAVAKRARAVAVKQRRQIVSMRDRAWGEFSLWGVVCMGVPVCCFLRSGLELCKMSRGEDTLERAKIIEMYL